MARIRTIILIAALLLVGCEDRPSILTYQKGDKVLLKIGVEGVITYKFLNLYRVLVVIHDTDGNPIRIEQIKIPVDVIEKKIE